MIILKIFKWIVYGFIALLALAYASVWLYYGVINPVKPPDHFHGIPADHGVGPTERVMSYVQSSHFLGDTPYKVMVGVSQFDTNNSEKNWDYYFCWIHKEIDDPERPGSQASFFSRWFPSKIIPAELWEKQASELVKFDAESRIATIDLGFTNLTCQLPPPDKREIPE